MPPLAPRPSTSTPEEPPPVFEFYAPPRPGGPWLGVGLLAGAATALFALSVRNDYLLGQVSAVLLGLGGLHGLWRGALHKMLMLPVSIGIVYLLARQVAFADPVIRLMAGKSSVIGNGIACGLAIVLTLMVVGKIVRMLLDRIARKHQLLLTADRVFGTILGLAEGAFVVLCLCWTAVLLEPQARAMQAAATKVRALVPVSSFQKNLSAGLVQLVDEIDAGPLRSVARDSNLLERIPSVQDLITNFGNGPDNPDWQQRMTEFLRQTDSDESANAGGPFQAYRRGNLRRDRAYRQLPRPSSHKR